MRKTRRSDSAFTLIEMLVVVVIALLLTGMVAAFALSSLERANRIGCVNNLRQVMMAIHLYAAEHQQMLPRQAIYDFSYECDWSGLLTNGYIGGPQAFRCPSDNNARRTNFDGRAWRSYCVNGSNSWCGAWAAPYKWPWPAPEETPLRISEIPAHVILIGENHGIDGGTGPGQSGAVVGISEMEGMQGLASAMHRDLGASSVASTDDENGGGNYAYVDGRVEYHTRADFRNPNAAFDGGPRDPWKWR